MLWSEPNTRFPVSLSLLMKEVLFFIILPVRSWHLLCIFLLRVYAICFLRLTRYQLLLCFRLHLLYYQYLSSISLWCIYRTPFGCLIFNYSHAFYVILSIFIILRTRDISLATTPSASFCFIPWSCPALVWSC